MRPGHLTGESTRPWHPTDISWTDEESEQIYGITSAGWWPWSKSGTLGGCFRSHWGELEVRIDPKKLNVD